MNAYFSLQENCIRCSILKQGKVYTIYKQFKKLFSGVLRIKPCGCIYLRLSTMVLYMNGKNMTDKEVSNVFWQNWWPKYADFVIRLW